LKNKNLFSVLILTTSTFLVGVLSYAYHPIMIRYLDLKQFAEFESLIWIINLLTVIVTAISLFLVKELSKKSNEKKIKVMLNIALRKLWFLWLSLYILYILFSPILANFLHIENIWVVILTWSVIFISFLSLYQNSFLQATKEFKILAWINLLNPIFRIFFWIILIYLWFNVFWAIWWFIIAFILLFIIRFFIVKNKSKKYISEDVDEKNLEQEIISDFKSQKYQIFHFFLSSIILAILMNIDILFAKHFFEPEIAGTYAWISIIAKFLVFVWMSIETVYYPVLTTEKNIDKKKIFLLSSLYFIMTLWALWFFYLFWEKILYIFKPWFEQYLDLLYLIIIYCWALSLLNFIVKILIAFNKYILNYILIFLLFICIILLYKFTNNSMYNLINIFNILIWVSLMSWFLYLWLVKNEK